MIGCLILSLILIVLFLITLLGLNLISMLTFVLLLAGTGGIYYFLISKSLKKSKEQAAPDGTAKPKPAKKPESKPAPAPKPASIPKPAPAPAPQPLLTEPKSGTAREDLERWAPKVPPAAQPLTQAGPATASVEKAPQPEPEPSHPEPAPAAPPAAVEPEINISVPEDATPALIPATANPEILAPATPGPEPSVSGQPESAPVPLSGILAEPLEVPLPDQTTHNASMPEPLSSASSEPAPEPETLVLPPETAIPGQATQDASGPEPLGSAPSEPAPEPETLVLPPETAIPESSLPTQAKPFSEAGSPGSPAPAASMGPDPIPVKLGKLLAKVREQAFTAAVIALQAHNKRQKLERNKIGIHAPSPDGPGGSALVAWQITAVQSYLAQYPQLPASAGRDFFDKLKAQVLGAQPGLYTEWLQRLAEAKAGASPVALVACEVAAVITGSPASGKACELVTRVFQTFADKTVLEAAKALGDKRMVTKLTNRLAKTKS